MLKPTRSVVALAAFASSLAVAVLVTNGAHAQSLPAATSFADCTTSSGDVDDASSCDVGTDRASVTLSPYAAVTASGDYPGGLARVNAGAIADLKYSFEVLGGTSGDLVSVDVDSLLSETTYGGGYAFSEIVVTTNEGGANISICSTGCGAGDGLTSYSGVSSFLSRSGEEGSVELETEGRGSFSTAANGGSASADPLFSIDPSSLGAANYRLVLSSGVANSVPTVPEPSTWLLVFVGLGGLGAAARRRRAQGVASLFTN